MSKSQTRKINFFVLVNEIKMKEASQIKDWLYRCAANNNDAILFISGDKGDEHCVNDIMATMKALDIHVTTVGLGNLSGASAAVFCLGDERVLMDGACLRISYLQDGGNGAYREKTLLTKEIFREKVLNSKDRQWDVKKQEYKRYGITTITYSKLSKRIMSSYGRSNQVIPIFYFDEVFNAASAINMIKYIYDCAACNQDAVVEICSTGGEVSSLSAIVETLRCTKVKLITIGGGIVASCAADLFLLGDIRCLKERTLFLLHKSGWSFKEATRYKQGELEKIIRDIRTIDAKTESFWLPRITITKEEYRKKVEGDKDWIIPEEDWKKYGIVTTEYEDVRDLILERMKTE